MPHTHFRITELGERTITKVNGSNVVLNVDTICK